MDLATLERLLPAMVDDNAVRELPIAVPAVLGPDTAVLPQDDGRLLKFTLRGPRIPASEAFEPAVWTRIDTTFAPGLGPPTATVTTVDRLSAAGVALALRVPAGSSLVTTVVEPAIYRVACLYSLVVNAAGDRDAKCLVVTELGAERTARLSPCDVVVTAGDGAAGDEEPVILQ